MGKAGEALGEGGARTSDVPTHKAFAFETIVDACIEPKVGLGAETLFKRLAIDAESGGVHPHEISALESGEGKVGKVILAELLHVLIIVVEIDEQGIKPSGSLAIGCFGGNDSEGVDIAHFVVVDGAVNEGTARGVGTDDVGYL